MTEKNQKSILDIVSEMREFSDTDSQTIGRDVLRKRIQDFARRIEQSVTNCNQFGNDATIREALESLVCVIDECNSGNPLWWHIGAKGMKPLKDARAALSEPPRNCDCHLAKNLIGAVTIYCIKNPGLPPMVEWNAIQYLEFCKWLFSEVKED